MVKDTPSVSSEKKNSTERHFFVLTDDMQTLLIPTTANQIPPKAFRYRHSSSSPQFHDVMMDTILVFSSLVSAVADVATRVCYADGWCCFGWEIWSRHWVARPFDRYPVAASAWRECNLCCWCVHRFPIVVADAPCFVEIDLHTCWVVVAAPIHSWHV